MSSCKQEFLKKAAKSKPTIPAQACLQKEQNTLPHFISETTTNKSSCGDIVQTVSDIVSETVPATKHGCSLCGRLFTRAYDLRRHSLVHLNVEACEVREGTDTDCQNVKGGSKERTDLNKEIVLYKCKTCSCMFKAKDSYERHKRIHTGERPYQCTECGKRFRDSGSLSRHVREVHAKVKSHPCDICDKWFANRATLEDHVRTHTGERPFVCHQCGIMFKSRAALYQHNKTHSDHLPHTCEYCGKRFRRRQQLVVHLPSHTDEKSHTCDKCGKGFATRSELQRHIVVHSDERPFVCTSPGCEASFSQKRYLKNHVKHRHSKSECAPSTGLIALESVMFG